MGERTEFEPGDKAPNNGTYIEIGETAFHMGIENPKKVTLSKGDKFPETTNKDRKWKLKKRENEA
ncbi:YjzC family protein [Marinicrinis lubricantis]|uniref:YjzC family protein n=1 Tax=Marinicrinis lubricantis TaxID=2086470 RepID=A0ABW1IIL0_9BACL